MNKTPSNKELADKIDSLDARVSRNVRYDEEARIRHCRSILNIEHRLGTLETDLQLVYTRIQEIEAGLVRRKIRNRLARLFQRLAAKLVTKR